LVFLVMNKTILNMLRRLLLLFVIFFNSTSIIHAQTYFEDDAINAGIDHFSSYLTIIPGTIGSQGQAMGGGVAWLDVDNDGWEDLYLPGGQEPDQLCLNNQDGTFIDISVSSGIHTATVGVETMGVSCADIDRDGDVDIIVTTTQIQPNLLFLNNGNGTFSEAGEAAGITDLAASQGVSCGDYDQDGWIDLYFTAWRVMDEFVFVNEAYYDRLYHNNGDGTFSDVTQLGPLWTNLGCGLASVFSDFDLDGDADLLVANDFGLDEWTDPNQIYSNENGVFSNVTDMMDFGLDMHAMGVSVGDFDEDNDFDYYITNIDTNALMRNDGMVFTNVVVDAGVESDSPVIGQPGQPGEESWSWGTVFFDYNHDTYLDLFSSNGFITFGGFDQCRLFENNAANGTFTDVSIVTGMSNEQINRGCAVADYDHDGDLDMFIVTMDTVDGTSRSQLMKNVGATENWIEFDLIGTYSNVDALGSVVQLSVDGRHLLREVDSGGSSFLSHHSPIVHFGLAQYAMVDSVTITWPNGNSQKLYDVSTNQRLQVQETIDPTSVLGMLAGNEWIVYPNPSNGLLFVKTAPKHDETYHVRDSSGRLMLTGMILGRSDNHLVDIRSLEAGIYLFSIGRSSQVITKF
jgi:hypothetical protein